MPESPANVNEISALPDDVRESVAVANLKAFGDAGPTLMNLAIANAVSHQQAMNAMLAAITAKAVDAINRPGVETAGLVSAVTQILTKSAQTTPPITAPT